MKDEIWKEIKGFEGFYELSNYGRVRSLDRVVYFKNGKGKRNYKGKILKQKYRNGYAIVNLNKNKKITTISIHVEVAKHFVKNPNPKKNKIVNHKDGVKSNNYYKNLEWSNNEHARKNGLHKSNTEGLKKYNEQYKLKIECRKGNKSIYVADSSREMAEYLIENNVIDNKNIETVSRAIRKYSKNNKPYKGLRFIRLNCPVTIKKEKDNEFQISMIYEGKILNTLNTSKECAKFLLENEYIENATERTVARTIRKSINSGKKYHGINFIKVKY